MVAVVSSKVDEETLRRMKQYPHINWSAVIREAIEKKLDEEEERLFPPKEQMLEAIRRMDAIREPSPPGWNSTEEIRKWRDRR